jgi:hypothetical protein
MVPSEEMVKGKLKELFADDGDEENLATMTEYVMVMVNNNKSAEVFVFPCMPTRVSVLLA